MVGDSQTVAGVRTGCDCHGWVGYSLPPTIFKSKVRTQKRERPSLSLIRRLLIRHQSVHFRPRQLQVRRRLLANHYFRHLQTSLSEYRHESPPKSEEAASPPAEHKKKINGRGDKAVCIHRSAFDLDCRCSVRTRGERRPPG